MASRWLCSQIERYAPRSLLERPACEWREVQLKGWLWVCHMKSLPLKSNNFDSEVAEEMDRWTINTSISILRHTYCDIYPWIVPLAVLSLHMYVPLSSSCTELSSSRHFFPSKCILQLSNAGWISFPSASQSTSVSFGPMTWHSNKTVSPALAVMSLTGRMTARLGSTGGAGCTWRTFFEECC